MTKVVLLIMLFSDTTIPTMEQVSFRDSASCRAAATEVEYAIKTKRKNNKVVTLCLEGHV